MVLFYRVDHDLVDLLGTVVEVKEYYNKRKSVLCEYGAKIIGSIWPTCTLMVFHFR